jgi:Leucine-rich repeat (LRR) protein
MCAKVYNPAIFFMKKGNTTWTELAGVQRLEIEDHEGILSTIPKELITELNRLESLTVNWTKIRSLPERLFQLPLNSLYLQRNQIRSLNGIDRAANTLTILDMSNNCIDALPKTFGELVNLVTLNLSGNFLRELPETVGSLVRLRALDVSSNKLRVLPASISGSIDLESLDVSNNQLTELPESLTALPNLKDLRASGNRLSALPGEFRRLARLSSLLLRGNQFTEVPAALAELSNLSTLNMRDNAIVRMLRPIRSLVSLVLDNNQLDAIDDNILGCTNLQLLSLQNNRLTRVPVEISQLTNLRTLLLSENGVSDIPVELERVGHLSNLGLRSTRVVTIPVEVAQMSSLKTLDLEDCSELNVYLKLAYKERGLPGIIEELSKSGSQDGDSEDGEGYEQFPDVPTQRSGIAVTPGARFSRYPDSSLQDKSNNSNKIELKGLSKRDTIMPPEVAVNETALRRDATGGKKSQRHEAGLSIVEGRTTIIDVDDKVPSRKIKNTDRDTMLPPAFEARATGDNRRGVGGSGSVPVVSTGAGDDDDDQPEIDTGNVICTLDNFGDLVSSSIDDNAYATVATVVDRPNVAVATSKMNKPPIGTKPAGGARVGGGSDSGEARERSQEDEFNDEDLSQLYAQVSKKTAKSSAGGGSGGSGVKVATVRFADNPVHTRDYSE